MSVTQELHIGEEPSETGDDDRGLYQAANPIEVPLDLQYGPQVGRFVDALCEELGKETLQPGIRSVDELQSHATGDVDFGYLFVFPDESLLFIGSDPTAKTVPVFGFCIERGQPLPPPQTAQDALDLLRPGDVRDAFASSGPTPARQGEWWLLPTGKMPVGGVIRPGVKERPYGASPLDNHVPREYAFTQPDDEFVTDVRAMAPGLPGSAATPREVIEWLDRQHRKRFTPDAVPEWRRVWDAAGDILIRGTLRHRNNEHYVENVGEEWHEAQTHDIDVYTGDDYISEVRLD